MLTAAQALLRATAQASFWQAYETCPDIMEGLFQRVESDADQETYPGLAYAPRPREMTGSRDHRSVPQFSFTISNVKYESTVDIDYALWKYGRLNAVQSMLQSMGEKARAFPNRLIGDLINAGDATAGHDSQNYFSAAHVDAGARYSTAQDNDFTSAAATGTVPTDLEFASAARGMIDAMYGFLDGEGDPVNVGPNPRFIALVPAEMLSIARSVANSDMLTGPVSNDLQGMFEVRFNPYDDNSAEFFMFRADGARKPFIYQVAEDVSLEDNMGGDAEFETKDISFGSFGYYNVGYGDWRYATRHIFT